MMARIGMWVLLASVALLLRGCEREQSTPQSGGKATGTTQPTATSAAEGGVKKLTEEGRRLANEGQALATDIIRQARETYNEKVSGELTQLDGRIKELREKLAGAAQDARPALEKRIDELNAKVRAARESFDKLAGASDKAWEEARKGLDRALGELRTALDQEAGSTQPATQPTDSAGRGS